MPSRDHTPSAEQSRWFVEEVQPHEPALRAWLLHQFPSLDDVDDVVQESYLSLLRKRTTGRIGFTRTYLFTIARHAALKCFRRRRIYSDVPVNQLPEWRLLDGGADVGENISRRHRGALMAAAVVQLPERCREIIKLRAVQGLSYAEIAAQLNLSEATVRVQIARGIKKCADFMRAEGVDEDPR